MEKKTDRRIKKTKKLIKETFIEFLLEKPIQEIRVQALAEKADINRGTFYQHYDDIYDLLNSIEDEIIEEFTSVLEDSYKQAELSGVNLSRKDVEPILIMLLDRILSYVKENNDEIVALFRDDQNSKIKQKLRKYLYDFFVSHYSDANKSEKFQHDFVYFYSYCTSGCVEVITTWIRNGLKEDTQDIAKLLEEFILNGGLIFLPNE